MTLGRYYFLICDPCGLTISRQSNTSRQARAWGRRNGWTRRLDAEGVMVDVCPGCKR